MTPWGGMFVVLLIVVVLIAILVAIARWIFRINEILACGVEAVKRLDILVGFAERHHAMKEIPPPPVEAPAEESTAYQLGKKAGDLFAQARVPPSPPIVCPVCNVPVAPAKPICPKCGQRVRLSRPV